MVNFLQFSFHVTKSKFHRYLLQRRRLSRYSVDNSKSTESSLLHLIRYGAATRHPHEEKASFVQPVQSFGYILAHDVLHRLCGRG